MKKLTKIWIGCSVLFCILLILISGCKKSEDNNSNPQVTTVTDKDGNVYHTVTIGTQVWMVENLKTTKFNDGSSIQLVTDNTEWSQMTSAAYCWYNNEIGFKDTYGALYNYEAANSGKLCPSGWHIPTPSDWNTLAIYLGGKNVAGGKLKEAGTSHWTDPNTGATNESGFTALAGGWREVSSDHAIFKNMNEYGMWHGTYNQTTQKYSGLFLDNESAYMNLNEYEGGDGLKSGISVRCIKN